MLALGVRFVIRYAIPPARLPAPKTPGYVVAGPVADTAGVLDAYGVPAAAQRSIKG